jgi:hypothetical protein
VRKWVAISSLATLTDRPSGMISPEKTTKEKADDHIPAHAYTTD